MNESTFPSKGREKMPETRERIGSQPETEGEQAGGRAPSDFTSQAGSHALGTNAGDPHTGRFGRILPWVIAAAAVLLAAIAVGVFLADESSEPRPVARLNQVGPALDGIPIDEETALGWEVTDADFVSYGAYGSAEIWSTTTPTGKDCLGVVVHGSTWMFFCSAPTFGTIVDIDIDANLVPPSPSGEPSSAVRFVLHDDVVDVYLAQNPEGGFY